MLIHKNYRYYHKIVLDYNKNAIFKNFLNVID